MPAQTNSTTRMASRQRESTYVLESAHPDARPSTNPGARCSSAYILIIECERNTANAVPATGPVDYAVLVPALNVTRINE